MADFHIKHKKNAGYDLSILKNSMGVLVNLSRYELEELAGHIWLAVNGITNTKTKKTSSNKKANTNKKVSSKPRT